MEFYNKIMIYFWLTLSIVSGIVITYMCIQDGLERWMYYYVVPVLSLLMYFFRKWMVNRMNKHLKFLEEQNKKK